MFSAMKVVSASPIMDERAASPPSTSPRDAAAAMKITAQDLKKLGVIDEIVPEPQGGAHRGADDAMAATGQAIARALTALDGLSAEALRSQRRDKFLAIGRSL